MESPKSFEAKFQRVCEAIGETKDGRIARALGIKPPSVAAARKREQIPTGWVESIAKKYNVSADWLFFGEGPMRRDTGEIPQTPDTGEEDIRRENQGLRNECQSLRDENRELRQENRDFAKENKALIEQNAELRIELEVLKLRPDKSEKTNEADLRRSA